MKIWLDVLKFLCDKFGLEDIKQELSVVKIFDELGIDFCFIYNGKIWWVEGKGKKKV